MNLTLDHLAPDHSGSITAVNASGMAGERMAALGLIPGRRVALLRRAPFGGPLHLRHGFSRGNPACRSTLASSKSKHAQATSCSAWVV